MLGLVVVLLGHEHTLFEDVLVDEFAIGLGNKPRWSVEVSVRLEVAYIAASLWRSSGDRVRCESWIYRVVVVVLLLEVKAQEQFCMRKSSEILAVGNAKPEARLLNSLENI